MNLLENLQWRYATKRMNGSTVPQTKIDNILEAIRLTPTSYGFQAFKVFVIENKELKNKIFNEACQQPQINEASHVLVLAATKKVNQAQIDEFLQLIATTRNVAIESLERQKNMLGLMAQKSEELNFVWTARQTYIALGVAMVAAAEEKVDATPIEGFNPAALDEILGLSEQNLGSVTLLALGYRDAENDYLASAKKVRKTNEQLIETIK